MQWNPDPYALDFAEQNGFLAADLLEGKRKSKEQFIVDVRFVFSKPFSPH